VVLADIPKPLLYIRVQDDVLVVYDAGAENWAKYKTIFDSWSGRSQPSRWTGAISPSTRDPAFFGPSA